MMCFWIFNLFVYAELPMPIYPQCGEIDRPDLCPPDLNNRWTLLSTIPENARSSIRPAELDLGSGNRVDRAWRYSTGRFDVLLAFMDSGFRWSHSEVVNKFYLNSGELPLPQFADGSVASTYDANGDGLFNVQDYAEDTRIDWGAGPDGGSNVLDPADLIYTFSDGVDDDGNGYTDDISGWDFFGRDNDAFHTFNDGFGTHGAGVIREAAAEGNNGDRIGVCPNCAILPLRVGDTFITDGGRVAEAISYAADQDSTAVGMAIGGLSNPDSAVEAAAYAFSKGTLLVGVTGDENSFHHNYPAALDNILYVHSITHNTANSSGDVYSFMNTWNCNNYGLRINLVAASTACATGSVAQIVGVAGLLQSAARDQETELSAGELFQLLQVTATDVSLTDAERDESEAYPSKEGWDAFYGYGRVNAEGAVKAVVDGEIPPVVLIDSPKWFQTFDSNQQANAMIDFRVQAARASSFEWSMEIGYGAEPDEWTEIASGEGQQEISQQVEIDLSTIPDIPLEEATYSETNAERFRRAAQPAVTVRVRATDSSGNKGELRKSFFVKRDMDLLANFPLLLGGSIEASPIMYDVNNDGVLELIIAESSGVIHVMDGTGSPVEGFPVYTDIRKDLAESPAFADISPVHDLLAATPAAGDLDGDGDVELVVAGYYGGVYAWHHDGTQLEGFPRFSIGREAWEFDKDHTYDQGFMGAPALYDLDDNGTLEIIANGMDSRLYVFDHTGNDWGPYPIEICAPEICGDKGYRIVASPTIGDIDGDGELEIGVASNEAVNNEQDSVSYLIDASTGSIEPDWPQAVSGLIGEAVLLPLIGEGHPASLAVADLDGDGDMEIANPVMLGLNSPIHHDGTEALDISFYGSDFHEDSNADIPALVQMISNPAWGDLNQDGVPEYVSSGVSSLYLASIAVRTEFNYQQGIGAWDGATGGILAGWPRQLEDVQFISAPGIADVDGDGQADVIAVSGGYLVHAWTAQGKEIAGWPKFTGGWILGSPTLGDIDGDGFLDIAVSTREGQVFVWKTDGHADQKIEWASIHHDAQNTGNYHHPLPIQDGPAIADPGVSDPAQPVASITEEGCCGSSGNKAALWLLGPISLLLVRRRKSTHS